MPEKIEFIEGEFQKVSLKDDDIVVISYPGILTAEATEKMKETAQRHFPNNKILILDSGIKIGALSPES